MLEEKSYSSLTVAWKFKIVWLSLIASYENRDSILHSNNNAVSGFKCNTLKNNSSITIINILST